MSIVNNLFEIEIGNTPESYDVAIVPINENGGLGELNQFPLKAYNFDFDIVSSLDLEKGFDIYTQDNKTIIFIVTVGHREAFINLGNNLRSALTTYLEKLSNKKIWLPLMGTGVGKLSFEDSYLLTEQILQEYRNYIKKYNCKFTISFPKTSEAEDLYKSIAFESDKMQTKNKNNVEHLEWVKDTLQIIQSKFKVSFYLVGTHWNNEDQSKRFYEEQIWENGYENGSFYDIVNEVKVGDVLIVKSTFAKDKKSILRIKAFGIVSENPINGRELQVNWVNILEESYDIEGLGHYRNTISTINQDDLLPILMFMGSKNLESLFYDIQSRQKATTTLAGLITDVDDGEDYLDIREDVQAFARVMAAKSFQPPLAIALLGKWGSGKSFFMRKLKSNIQTLSKQNPQDAFCEGIAHVHFNSWSYMDANLWASIVTRIFEGLDEYIKDTNLTKEEKGKLEKELYSKLNFSKEELETLKSQQKSLSNRISSLEIEKNALKEELDNRIETIKKKTLLDVLKKVDSEFKVQEKIKKALNGNPTFVATADQFEKIVPPQYWENPSVFYNELKSVSTFFKVFFKRSNWINHSIWISIIILVLLVPKLLSMLTEFIGWQNFTISNKHWATITIIGSAFVRFRDTYVKLKKQIAPFWKIKEDYEMLKVNEIFKMEQEEKALRLEIENYKEEILQLDQQINTNKELIATLEFRIENTLSTEALYSFIEKRANSDDYKKHLGIVSLIRKDFEILSGLLTEHNTELVSSVDSEKFKRLFKDKKPLERIILYIDDLDRCPEERVVEVLEAVNLLMAFPLFVVVVGVDPRWVKKALDKKYKNQFSNGVLKEEAISASNYLEKIFQIPFHLKNANNDNVKSMIKTLSNFQPKLKSIKEAVKTSAKTEKENLDEKIDTNLNVTDVVSNTTVLLQPKNSLEALRFTENEIQLLEGMSDIIGNNPRAIKRFVNIYRVIKAHEDFDNSILENELQIIMFLIALPLGKFSILIQYLERYLNGVTNTSSSLEKFLHHTHSINIDDDVLFLKDELYRLISIYNKEIFQTEIRVCIKHYSFIKRFTFKNI